MKHKKFLILAAAGMIVSAMLSLPVMAAGTPLPDTPVQGSDNSETSAPGNTVYSGELPQGEAVPYPTDIQLLEQGARNYLYKTYTVAANYEPDLLVEPPFSQGGYRYRFSEIIQRDSTPASNTKTVTESKTVDCSTNDQAEILALFGGKLPYSDAEGYEGELFLIPESLIISESGRTTYNYTVSGTQRYENLDNNDMAYVPKTMEKNGLTLALQNVDWQVTGSDNMGYSQVANQYTAIAYYSAPATGSKASGYTATASFSGDVTRQMIGKNTYTIVYEGEQIVIPFNYIPLIIAGVIVAGCIVAAIILWRLRRNVTIYTLQQGVPELYGKVRIWDLAKQNRLEQKAIVIDECWQLIGSGSSPLAADFMVEIAKIARAYNTSAIFASQDISDFFALENGKYGKAILNNSKTKIILNLEPHEAEKAGEILNLTATEIHKIKNFERGYGILSSNGNNIAVRFRASELENSLLSTDPQELKRMAEEKRRQMFS